MTDTTLFTAGSLFTSDYLTHGITETANHAAVDTVALAARLTTIVDTFPTASQPNEAQTEDDLIWPVLAALGWTCPTVCCLRMRQPRHEQMLAREWQRYGYSLAVVESKRWARPLDRAGRPPPAGGHLVTAHHTLA